MLSDIVRSLTLARNIALSLHWHAKCLCLHKATADIQAQLYEASDEIAEAAVFAGETIDLSTEKMEHCQKEYKLPSPNNADAETLIDALTKIVKALTNLSKLDKPTQALVDDVGNQLNKMIYILRMAIDKSDKKPNSKGLFD